MMITTNKLFLLTCFFAFSLQGSSLKSSSLDKTSKMSLDEREVVRKYEDARFSYRYEKYDRAKRKYEKALELSQKTLGHDHNLTKALQQKESIYKPSFSKFNAVRRLYYYYVDPDLSYLKLPKS